MAPETRMYFDEVENLTNAVHRAKGELSTGGDTFGASGGTFDLPVPTASFRQTSTMNFVPESMFGNTSAGLRCQTAHQEAKNTMGKVLHAFENTLSSDAERLEVAMATFRATDAANADAILQTHRKRLDIFNGHLADEREGGDPVRAEQLTRMLDLTAAVPMGANTVVAGDFNAVSDDGGQAAQALGKYGQAGYDVKAGDIDDGKGGTSSSYRRIDYVMPRGIGHDEATRWDRGISDHDGIAVDVTMPNW